MCNNFIKYENISFETKTCKLGNAHPLKYAVKCSKCTKSYGNWIEFKLSLFPGYPDPDKCKCNILCSYCGFNRQSLKCCRRVLNMRPQNSLYENNIDTILESNLEKILIPINESNDDLFKYLQYPFSYINKEENYIISDICTGLINEEPINIGDFPNNISEYYWVHEGENEEEDWHLLCKINTDDNSSAYIYYTASCDYTGFDCRGSMRIYISRNAKSLILSLDGNIKQKLLSTKNIT